MMDNNWRIANFVELAQDKYGNRSYTNGHPMVIRAAVEPGTGKPGTWGSLATLHIIEPEEIKRKWPTINAINWIEVDHEAGPLLSDEREELIQKTEFSYITA